jgi:hypothetical protein
MAREYAHTLMVKNIKESGRIAKSMAREYLDGEMVTYIKESLRITKLMDME